jgi:hypothetical protein
VDDPAYMDTAWAAGKDVEAQYNQDCGSTVPGAALNFDGENDIVQGPAGLIPVGGAYTVSVWAKQDNFVSGQLKNIIAQGRQFYIGQYVNDTIRIGDNWYATGVPWPTDTLWHNYAVVRTDSNTYLYLDGVLRATAGYPIPVPGTSPPTDPNGTFFLGSQWSGNAELFDGNIDEVRIWNKALTAAEIQQNLNCEVTYARPGLVATYNFNQGIIGNDNPADTILLDASGNNRNLVLKNFALTAGGFSDWVAPGAVVSGVECCNLTLTTSVGDTLFICTEDREEPYTGNVNLVISNGTAPYIPVLIPPISGRAFTPIM